MQNRLGELRRSGTGVQNQQSAPGTSGTAAAGGQGNVAAGPAGGVSAQPGPSGVQQGPFPGHLPPRNIDSDIRTLEKGHDEDDEEEEEDL